MKYVEAEGRISKSQSAACTCTRSQPQRQPQQCSDAAAAAIEFRAEIGDWSGTRLLVGHHTYFTFDHCWLLPTFGSDSGAGRSVSQSHTPTTHVFYRTGSWDSIFISTKKLCSECPSYASVYIRFSLRCRAPQPPQPLVAAAAPSVSQ